LTLRLREGWGYGKETSNGSGGCTNHILKREKARKKKTQKKKKKNPPKKKTKHPHPHKGAEKPEKNVWFVTREAKGEFRLGKGKAIIH